MFFALIGLVLAAGVIVPPVYVHETDREYKKLFPILSYGKEYLEKVTNQYFDNERGQKHAYQTQSQFPIDEVAASTIEETELKHDNFQTNRIQDNFPVQRQIPPGDELKGGEAGHKYK